MLQSDARIGKDVVADDFDRELLMLLDKSDVIAEVVVECLGACVLVGDRMTELVGIDRDRESLHAVDGFVGNDPLGS